MLQKFVQILTETVPSLLTAQNLTNMIEAFLDLSSNAFSLTGSSSNAAAASTRTAQTPNCLPFDLYQTQLALGNFLRKQRQGQDRGSSSCCSTMF